MRKRAIVGVRNVRQLPISAPTGLFSGGTQRTLLVMAQARSVSPSFGSAAYSPVAKPNFSSVA